MSNILFLFEGASRERDYYKVIEKSFNEKISSNVNIYCYKTNIYVLYQELYEDNSLDLLSILKNRAKEQNEVEEYNMLSNTKFGEIYLIFDLDPQDDRFSLNKIKKMLDLFNNETEYGKLYINYPMIESFKHFKSIPDKDYYSYKIGLSKCKTYKRDVAKISCINNHKKINKEIFISILIQNFVKSCMLIKNKEKCDFDTYRENISQNNIFKVQSEEIKNNNELYILNTFCLWPLDYFKKDFFDEIINNED